MKRFRYGCLFGCMVLGITGFVVGQNIDFNGDGALDCNDVDPLSVDIANGTHTELYDLDDDGLVTRSDLSKWLRIAGNTTIGSPFLLGDVFFNGDVGHDDRGELEGWRFKPTAYCRGDLNADGRNDISDHMILWANLHLESAPELGVGNGESLISSGLAQFIYDPTRGEMFVSSSAKVFGIVIPGPEAIETYYFDGFFEGAVFNNHHFADRHQWWGYDAGGSGIIGNRRFAAYPTGLTSSDFGPIEFGTWRYLEELPGVLTSNVIVESVLAGDANLDGVVDVADFNLWNENKFTNVTAWGEGDFNGDGFVDTADFNLWNSNKFTSAGWGDAASVPEPSGLVLCLVFSVFLVRSRRSSSRN